MQSVEIEATLQVRRDGEVIIRHQIDGVDSAHEGLGLFGFPGRDLTDAECREIITNLAKFIRERYKLEVEHALARTVRQQENPQQKKETKK